MMTANLMQATAASPARADVTATVATGGTTADFPATLSGMGMTGAASGSAIGRASIPGDSARARAPAVRGGDDRPTEEAKRGRGRSDADRRLPANETPSSSLASGAVPAVLPLPGADGPPAAAGDKPGGQSAGASTRQTAGSVSEAPHAGSAPQTDTATAGQPLPDASVAPVLAALTEAANGATASAASPARAPQAAVIPQEAAPLPATAAVLTARVPAPADATGKTAGPQAASIERREASQPVVVPFSSADGSAKEQGTGDEPGGQAAGASARQAAGSAGQALHAGSAPQTGAATAGQPPPDASVAPMLAPLTEAANGATAAAASPGTPPQAAAIPQQAAPQPTTAAVLTARVPVPADAAGKTAGPQAATIERREASQPTVAPPVSADGSAKERGAGNKGSDGSRRSDSNLADAPLGPMAASSDHAPTSAANAASGAEAGAVLSAHGADRQLDLAKQNAWLDGLARDIASAGATDGQMRFQVAPQHLGTVQVALSRTADGAAVTLTAASEASRTLLADARPQLVADARAHGLHIVSAEVTAAAGAQASGSDSHAQGGQPQPDARHGGSPSAQNGTMGGGGGQSQTRSQPIAPNPDPDGRPQTAAREADAPADVAADDGLYA